MLDVTRGMGKGDGGISEGMGARMASPGQLEHSGEMDLGRGGVLEGGRERGGEGAPLWIGRWWHTNNQII